MERWQHAFTQNDQLFKELFGVKKEVFLQMRDALIAADEQRRHRGRRRTKLPSGDQLLLTLQYWREYRTMAHLAYDFGLGKTTVCDTITQVENVLIQDERFHLPGKKRWFPRKMPVERWLSR